jgi:hypothetical protein
MTVRGSFLLLLALTLACRPHPKPPAPGDSTAVDTTVVGDTTVQVDTTGIDSTGLDTLRRDVAPADSEILEEIPEMTPKDTIPPDAPTRAGARAASGSAGFAFGLSQWPTAYWGAPPFSATMKAIPPDLLGGALRTAARAHHQLVIVAPRNLMTQNGQTVGLYVVDKAKALCTNYVRRVPVDSLNKYADWIVGVSLGDDFTNPSVWGGRAITPGTFAEVMTWCRSVFPPSIALGARQTPAYVSGSVVLARTIDFAWLQWLSARGTPRDFYSKGQAIADKFGFKTVRGANVHSCHRAGEDDPCKPSELDLALTEAMQPSGYPPACASLSWRYDEDDMDRPGVKQEYAILGSLAASLPAGNCHR